MKWISALVLGMFSLLILSATRTEGFSLLGPFAPWMTATNGFGVPNPAFTNPSGDIGGPMNIGEGYRWNVPVVTYGFDKSFLDYFGSNGVAAVKGAIHILNDLPPASDIVVTDYPTQALQVNNAAQAQNLYDLKSMTLTLLLEQMGLAQPTRFIYVLRQWDPILLKNLYSSTYPSTWTENGIIPNLIVQRNFDPISLNPSGYVNDSLYNGYLEIWFWPNQSLEYAIPVSTPVDPIAPKEPAVAGGTWALNAGSFWNGLTRDDAGGLRYLLSTNNIVYEILLPDVLGAGMNADSYVSGAWRPGVDKITFVPQPFDCAAGQFLPMTNQFTDTYITNGDLMHQELQRITTQPDFLFCAGNANDHLIGVPSIDRTGTTNWINNADLNGNPDGAGPGVIQPQVKIIFNKLGHVLDNLNDEAATDYPIHWGTFDSSTNAPITYPIPQTGTNQFAIRMSLAMGSFPNQSRKNFDWSVTNLIGSVSLFQTSTNLADWRTIFSVTNDGSSWVFENVNPSSVSRFYRVVPQ